MNIQSPETIKCGACAKILIDKSRKYVKRFCNNKCYNQWRRTRPTGYSGLHKRLYIAFGRADICEKCGKVWDKPRSIQWANKSGRYLNDLLDWIKLCISCHRFYDQKLRYNTAEDEIRCPRCELNLKKEFFHTDSSRPSGFNSICKSCSSAKSKLEKLCK